MRLPDDAPARSAQSGSRAHALSRSAHPRLFRSFRTIARRQAAALMAARVAEGAALLRLADGNDVSFVRSIDQSYPSRAVISRHQSVGRLQYVRRRRTELQRMEWSI